MDGEVRRFRNIVVSIVGFAVHKMKIIHEMKTHSNSIKSDMKREILKTMKILQYVKDNELKKISKMLISIQSEY